MTKPDLDPQNSTDLAARVSRMERELARAHKQSRWLWLGLITSSCFVAVTSGAQTSGLSLIRFVAGQPARADEINQNFETLQAAIEGDEAQLDNKLDRSATEAATPQPGQFAGGFTSGWGTDFARFTQYARGGQDAVDAALVFGDNPDDGLSVLSFDYSSGASSQVLRVDGYGTLSVPGTIQFSRQGCHDITGNIVWAECPDGEFVAAIDFDNNTDHVGGVRCCRF